MSTWLDLDKSDDESLSSANEDPNDYGQQVQDEYPHGLSKSKSMTLPTTFRMNNNNKHNNNSMGGADSHTPKMIREEDGINHHNNNNNNIVEPLRTYSYPIPDKEPFCVWLGNLPAEAKPSDIVKYLEPLKIEPRDIRFGRIHKNKYTCAYVDFYNKEDMKTALQSIDCSS
eukprot:824166_1